MSLVRFAGGIQEGDDVSETAPGYDARISCRIDARNPWILLPSSAYLRVVLVMDFHREKRTHIIPWNPTAQAIQIRETSWTM